MSPSASVAFKVMATAWSSSVVTLLAVATGASLTAVMVTLTVAGADVSDASFTVKVNASLPS